MTIIIGIGETREDFPLLERFIKKHGFERITIYALRPVRGTPFTEGPTPEEVAWWIAKTRIAFPKIEIIAGTAIYRIEEISLFLNAGVNAITKLPATRMFNTDDATIVHEQIASVGRTFTSTFRHPDPLHALDWKAILDKTDLTGEEKEKTLESLYKYLDTMEKRLHKEEKKD